MLSDSVKIIIFELRCKDFFQGSCVAGDPSADVAPFFYEASRPGASPPVRLQMDEFMRKEAAEKAERKAEEESA